MEQLLILATVERIGDSLPLAPPNTRRKGGKIKEYIRTLNDVVSLPQIELPKVLQPLLDLHEKISKIAPDSVKHEKSKEIAQEKLAKSRSVILELFLNYTQFAVDKSSAAKFILPNFYCNNSFHEYNTDDKLLEEQRDKEEDDADADTLISGSADEDEASVSSTMDQAPSSLPKTPNLDKDSFLSISPAETTNDLLSRTKTFSHFGKQRIVQQQLVKKIEEAVATSVFETMIRILHKPTLEYNKNDAGIMEEMHDQFSENFAKEVIFKLSLANFDNLRSLLEKYVMEGTESLRVLECVKFNQQQLCVFMKHCLTNAKQIAKPVPELVNGLRFAIWGWIENHPDEFQKVYQTKTALPNATELFEYMRNNLKSKEKKAVCFPLMFMLSILNPEKFGKAVKQGAKLSDAHSTFVHKYLTKTLNAKSKDSLFSSVVVCIIDLIKASTYLPQSEDTLRSLTDQLEPKLCELFLSDSISHFPRTADGNMDMGHISAFLKSVFIRDPNKALKILFLPCFDATNEHKLAVCKAILSLIAERSPNANAPFLPHYSKIIGKVLDLFTATQKLLNHGNEKEDLRKVAKKPTRNLPFEIVDTILHIFCIDPNLFLTQKGAEEEPIDGRFKFIADIFIETRNPAIQFQMIRLFRKLFLDRYITKWAGPNVQLFVEVTSTFFTTLSQALLEMGETEASSVRSFLSLLRSVTFRAKLYLSTFAVGNEEVANNRKRLQALEILSSNLLVTLCSQEREVWKTTTKCLKDICDQIEIFQNQDLKYLNYSFYRQLTSVDLDGDISCARKIQIQHFRRVESQTKSNLIAFNMIYRRWKDLLSIDQGVDKNQLSTYTSMLCALGGAVLQQSQDKKQAIKPDAKKVTRGNMMQENESKLDDFINDLMSVMHTHNIARQIVTNSIANDLAPALYDKIFVAMHDKIKKMYDDKGGLMISKENNIFIEQSISSLKTIMESKDAAYDLALITELDALLIIIFQYCSRANVDFEGVQMRIRFCYLVESAMLKSGYISFQDATLLRTKMLGVSEWMSDILSKVMKSVEQAPDIVQQIRISFKELDVVCIRAFASTLNGHIIKQEQVESFYNYFSFLEPLLATTKGTGSRIHVVKALEYLLHTNISAGLQTYMQKVYNPNEDVRSTFLILLAQAFKRNLSQENEVEANVEQQVVQQTNKYGQLVDLLVDFDMKAMFALFEVVKNNDKDEICEAVVRLLGKQGEDVILQALHDSVVREVKSTIQAETLFRANSTASKMMKKYCMRVGNPFLKKCIGSLVTKVCKNPKDYEIDPQKTKGEDIARNAKNCIAVIDGFLTAILQSITFMPRSFREYCKYLYNEVGTAFPGKTSAEEGDTQFEFKYIAVGGFLFLRLICPAITTPNLYGLMAEPSGNEARRFCIIITKVLQNLANGIVSNKKEEYMSHFEPYLLEKIPVIKQFFEELANVPEKKIPVEHVIKDEELSEAGATLHRFFFDYAESLRPNLQTLLKKEMKMKIVKEEREEVEVEVSAYDKLAEVLEALGKPIEVEKKAPKTTKGGDDLFSSTVLNEFVTKLTKIKDIDAQIAAFDKKENFYQKGNTIKGIPVFYFVPQRFENKESFLYHIIKKLEQAWTKPFCIVVDCTEWDEKNELPFPQFLKLARLIPKGAKKNLKQVIVYNPNLAFKNQTKKLAPIAKKANMSWNYACGLSEISKFIDNENLALTQSTLDLEKEIIATFSDMERIVQTNRAKETIIRLTPDNLIIITKDEQILNHETARFEAIPLSLISELSAKKSILKSNNNDFFIKYDDPERFIYLRAEDNSKDLLNQEIKSAIARKSRQVNIAKVKTKTLRIEDIPGEVLNICFMNLESPYQPTRFAAYNLLHSVAIQFNFPDTHILGSDIISVPRNTEDLVCEFSAQTAKTRPQLTLDFLLEALKGFEQATPKAQIMCVKYVTPWISNLPMFINDEKKQPKLKTFMAVLAGLTCTCQHAFPAVSDLWRILATDPIVSNYCIDTVINMGLHKGPYDEHTFPQFCDMVVTIAYQAADAITHRIFDILNDIIENQIALSNMSIILTDQQCAKLITLCRFLLSISFQNRMNVMKTIPRVFHAVLMLVGVGNVTLRTTVHALLINALHALCMEIPSDAQEKRQKFIQIMAHLKTPEYISLFFGTRKENTDFDTFGPPVREDPNVTVNEPIDMYGIERLAIYFLEIGNLFSTDQASSWFEELETTTKRVIHSGNKPLFSRALVTYGIFSGTANAHNMLDIVLGFLGKLSTIGFDSNDMITSIMLSIVHISDRVDPYEPRSLTLFSNIFLFGMFLIPLAKEEVQPSMLSMLLCVINLLYESNEMGKYSSIGHFFNDIARKPEIDKYITKFESDTGISFKEHFSFALATYLMRSLINQRSRERAIAFFKQLLIISNKLQFLTTHSLGFICALIPFENQYHSPVYCEHLFQVEIFDHPKREIVFLFQKYMFTIALELNDAEKIAIYRTLSIGFNKHPDTFADVFKDHNSMTHVIKAYSHSTNDELIECALTLFKAMSHNSKIKQQLSMKEPFEECGFKGFKDIAAPKKLRQELYDVATSFLQNTFHSVIEVKKPKIIPPVTQAK